MLEQQTQEIIHRRDHGGRREELKRFPAYSGFFAVKYPAGDYGLKESSFVLKCPSKIASGPRRFSQKS